MKFTYIWLLLFLITPVYAATPWLHTDANKIKDPDGNVVVLRGLDTIDIGEVERNRGGAINLINRLTNTNDPCGSSPGWYPKVIRLAVYPAQEADFSSPFTFNPGNDNYYNQLLRPVVDYCKTKDLYVIIDWHFVGDNTYDRITVTSQFWAYMAPRFANDSHVLFELFQEPGNNTGSSEAAKWITCRNDMQTWINIVRSFAPNNLILVGGPSWSQIIGPAATYPLTGDNIVMVSHLYPGHWTGLYGDPNYYKNHVNTCLTRYPVFMSEWGFRASASSQNLQGTIANYGQPISDFREERKISGSAWISDYSWEPQMFNSSWGLLVGPNEMGGFTKDLLYLKRNDDLPSGGDSTPPAAPTGVTEVNDYGFIPLNWNDNNESDIYAYNVYRSVISGEYGLRLNGEFLKNSNFTDYNVIPGITYYYIVTAIDTSLNESADSIEVAANPLGGAIYNFAGITQSNADYNAYACDVDIFPFAGDPGNRNTMVEATDQQYAGISLADSMEWAPAKPGTGDQVFVWVEMKINESAGDIAKIDLSFDGNTAGSIPTTHRIYVLKANADWTQDSSWVQVGSDLSIYPNTNISMTRSIGTNIVDYINANGKIIWGVYETASAQVMHINSLEMVVYGEGIGNPQPTVYITSPLNGTVFAQDTNIPINVYASDADGRVARVEFYVGQTKVDENTVAPFLGRWNYASVGHYILTAKAIDDDNNVTTSPDVNITVLGDVGTGALLYEWWTGISGTAVSDLTSNPAFPNQPTGRKLISSPEEPTNWADNYGTRIRGYLHPPADGNYTFWIASDAGSELWLSTDNIASNAVLIAYVAGQTNPREWTKYSSQQSSPISLIAGRKYYIEFLHKEGTGNDNIAIGWGDDPNQQVIEGMYLSPCDLRFRDFNGFAFQWRRSDCAPGNDWCNGTDFDRDGKVFYSDVKSFAESWLAGVE
jgi:hypothetical protein